jgi:hypothetical protein
MQEMKAMKKSLQFMLAAAFAAASGLVAAQMTPALPNSPANSAPTAPGTSSKTEASSSTSAAGASSGTFAKLDTDHDGTISKKEAASNKALTAKWDTLDANKDGKLGQGEFAQFALRAGTEVLTGCSAALRFNRTPRGIRVTSSPDTDCQRWIAGRRSFPTD